MFDRRYQNLTEGWLEARRKEREQRLRTLKYVALAVLGVAVVVAAFFLLRPTPPPPNNYTSTIDISGQDRPYHVHLPPSYDGETPLPVVLAFHGLTQTPEGIRIMSGFDDTADANDFIVVYPEGFLRVWEVDRVDVHQVDDLAFVEALLDRLDEELAIDTSRVYATGFSNGAQFTHRLACEMPDRIAAFAPVGGALSAVMYDDCTPSGPVPMLVVHGTEDRGVPYERQIEVLMGVPETVGFWVEHDGCRLDPTVSELPDGGDERTAVTQLTYPDCEAGAAVALLRVEGGGHTWPGGVPLDERQFGVTTSEIDASQLIWEFFEGYSLP